MRARLLAAVATAVALVAAPSVSAHDFWMQPTRFRAEAGAPLRVLFLVGHTDEIEAWRLTWERLNSLKTFGPDGVRDQQAGVVTTPVSVTPIAATPVAATGAAAAVAATQVPDPSGATITLTTPGTHIVAMESYHSLSVLPADRFNAYLQSEGLAAAVEQRRRAGTDDEPGHELYSRRSKALIQVGDVVSDLVTRPVGQTLEIVPERNPYAPSTDTRLPFRVYFLGQPLAGALIDITSLEPGSAQTQGQRTDAAGRVVFEVPRQGSWRINVTHARPVDPPAEGKLVNGQAKVDFDTVFASLSFGYPD